MRRKPLKGAKNTPDEAIGSGKFPEQSQERLDQLNYKWGNIERCTSANRILAGKRSEENCSALIIPCPKI